MIQKSSAGWVVVFALAVASCNKAENNSSGSPAPAPSAAPAPAPSAPPAPAEVKFDKRVPKAGMQSELSQKTGSKFTMAGKTYRENTVLEAAMTVKESDEFRVTKASIEVKEMYTTSQEGTGSEKRSVSPLAGSTYIVTRDDDGSLSALDSNGNKVPAATLKLIKDQFAGSFEKNRDAEFIPDRPLKLEEKLMPPSDAMLAALGIKDDGNTLIDGTEFFLKSAKDSKATFEVTMTMTQKVAGAGLRVRSTLKGTLEMQPDGAWITAVDLKGPITILDASGNDKGSGELNLSGSQTFK